MGYTEANVDVELKVAGKYVGLREKVSTVFEARIHDSNIYKYSFTSQIICCLSYTYQSVSIVQQNNP
jgi:hypothetical protein